MDLRFFDCNAFIGAGQKGTGKPAGDRAQMLAAMDDAGIERSLVWHVGQQDWSIAGGGAGPFSRPRRVKRPPKGSSSPACSGNACVR